MTQTAPIGLLEDYDRNGFMIVRGGYSEADIQEVLAEAVRICRGSYGEFFGLVPAQPGETDDDVLIRHLCIHYPHKVSQVIHRHLSHPAVVDALLAAIGSPNVKCLQSMLFIKASGKPGQAWHQDEYYIPTRDRSGTASWIALDDATTENGCLWVIPGSHKPGIIWPQEEHDDERFDCAGEAVFPYTDDDAIPVELKRGDVLIFNGYLLHRSLPNSAPAGSYRRCLTCHYMSAETLVPMYPASKNQNMGTHDMRDIVMVAGVDPYAWKGYASLTRPHVRPTGEGGCGEVYHNLIANQGQVTEKRQEIGEGHDARR